MPDTSDIFLSIERDGSMERLGGGPEFWDNLIGGDITIDGWLVSIIRLEESFAHWERHMDGEETVILREGGPVALDIETADGVRTEHLTAGAPVCIVPREHWHFGRAETPATLVFITPAGSTEHRRG